MMFSKASQFIMARWVLFAVMVVFTAAKIPHLSYPYYWDECWPYAPAIAQMSHHGISLLPGALDPDFSRGHPLLFHALAATWMRIFGNSHIAMHSFALVIALVMLVVIYESALRHFGRNVAIIALLLVATQVVFFVQSSFVMLEIILALWILLALWAYALGKYLQTSLWLTAAVFTKETALVLAFVLIIDAGVCLLNRNVAVKERLYRLCSVLVPLTLISVFFILQKQLRGWYVYPMHTDMMVFQWTSFWYKFRMSCMRLLFYDNYKFYPYLLLMLFSVVAALKSKKYRLLVLLLPAVILFYYVDDMRAGRILPSVPFFILFLGGVAWFAFNYASKHFFQQDAQRRFFYLSVFFVLSYCAFSAVNFFTYRYLIAPLVMMYFVTAILFGLMIDHSWRWMIFPVVIVVLLTGFFSFRDNHNIGDCDPGAFRAMKVQQHVVDYLERVNAYDSMVTTSSALEGRHLLTPESGFLHSARVFTHLQFEITPATVFIVTDNIEPDEREKAIRNLPDFVLADSVRVEDVWARIYRRK